MRAILFTLALAIPGAATIQTNSLEVQEILRLEAVWNAAHLRGDVPALDAICAADLTVIVPGMSPMSKADILGFWKSGRAKITQYDSTDVKVVVRGRTAVATGRLARTRDFNGTVMTDRWQFTKTYANEDGRWVLVAYHASEGPK
ncbi:MAG: hypothetical protein RLZZ53_795 [Acidobacteriota bacterium]|jgi:hypothetical protein